MSDDKENAGAGTLAPTPAPTGSVDQTKLPSMTIPTITPSTTVSQRLDVRLNVRINLVQPFLNTGNGLSHLDDSPLRLLLTLRAITKQLTQTLNKIVTNRSFHTPSPFCRSPKTTTVQGQNDKG